MVAGLCAQSSTNRSGFCHLRPSHCKQLQWCIRAGRLRNVSFATLPYVIRVHILMYILDEVTLKASTKTKAAKRSLATYKCIITAGEIFSDGAAIELVSGSSEPNKPGLFLWNGRTATASRVEHAGCVYEARELASSLYRAIRLPSRSCDDDSARSLFAPALRSPPATCDDGQNTSQSPIEQSRLRVVRPLVHRRKS